MTITLSPETEAKLRERAERDGQDVNVLADVLLSDALNSEMRHLVPRVEKYRRSSNEVERKTRLEQECAKLDPAEEQALAEEGMETDSTSWPQY